MPVIPTGARDTSDIIQVSLLKWATTPSYVGRTENVALISEKLK